MASAAPKYNLRSRKSILRDELHPSSTPNTPELSPEPPNRKGTDAAASVSRPQQAPVQEGDVHGEAHLEFGGAFGTSAMMLGFPLLFYFNFVCLYFYDAKIATPDDPFSIAGPGGWVDFISHIARLVYHHAAPTKRATAIYLFFVLGQLLLAFVMPGVKQKGLPLTHANNKTLDYNCNAYTSVYATIVLVAAAHYFHLGGFHLSEAIDLYGPLLTVASISGFVLAGVCYAVGERYRMSGNVIYDYFMGSSLNPRIGSVDIKMFAEIRISWTILFAFAMANVVKQYETYGYVSGNAALYAYGVWLYLNACVKAEQYIPQTWDMNFEKFGWLLSYWNFAGVPFSYAYPAIYMATHDPATYSWSKPVIIALFIIVTIAQGIMDAAMAQKSHFKAVKTGTYVERHLFPQWPNSELKNPVTFKTARGELLLDGCWKYLRKPNYISDWVQGLIWALSSGTNSYLPYWYPLFHGTMLLHRNARDDAKCARKYGKDWEEYKRRVPYSYIYGLF